MVVLLLIGVVTELWLLVFLPLVVLPLLTPVEPAAAQPGAVVPLVAREAASAAPARAHAA